VGCHAHTSQALLLLLLLLLLPLLQVFNDGMCVLQDCGKVW